MSLDGEDVKISIFLKDKGRLLANAVVSFNTIIFSYVTVKDFQLWESTKFNERLQEAINITPPTRNIYGKYSQRVFLEDKKKWIDLEARIYDAYCAARNKKQIQEKVTINETYKDSN